MNQNCFCFGDSLHFSQDGKMQFWSRFREPNDYSAVNQWRQNNLLASKLQSWSVLFHCLREKASRCGATDIGMSSDNATPALPPCMENKTLQLESICARVPTTNHDGVYSVVGCPAALQFGMCVWLWHVLRRHLVAFFFTSESQWTTWKGTKSSTCCCWPRKEHLKSCLCFQVTFYLFHGFNKTNRLEVSFVETFGEAYDLRKPHPSPKNVSWNEYLRK